MTDKTEAELAAEAEAAALALANLKRPRLTAALGVVRDIEAQSRAELANHPDGPARQAISAILSVATSGRGMIAAELASLPQEPEA